MHRECTNCRRPFNGHDFVEDASEEMESERRERGLEGLYFLYFECSSCGQGDVFLDLHRLDGESAEAFHARRAGLEAKVRQLRAERIDVVITERGRVA